MSQYQVLVINWFFKDSQALKKICQAVLSGMKQAILPYRINRTTRTIAGCAEIISIRCSFGRGGALSASILFSAMRRATLSDTKSIRPLVMNLLLNTTLDWAIVEVTYHMKIWKIKCQSWLVLLQGGATRKWFVQTCSTSKETKITLIHLSFASWITKLDAGTQNEQGLNSLNRQLRNLQECLQASAATTNKIQKIVKMATITVNVNCVISRLKRLQKKDGTECNGRRCLGNSSVIRNHF